MTAGVYAIVNTANGHRYIGSTKNFRIRSGSHRWSIATGNFFNKAMRAAWQEHGPDAFRIELLEETAADDDSLELAEAHWIQHFAVMNRSLLYNVRLEGKRWTRPARQCADCSERRAPRPAAGAEGE